VGAAGENVRNVDEEQLAKEEGALFFSGATCLAALLRIATRGLPLAHRRALPARRPAVRT